MDAVSNEERLTPEARRRKRLRALGLDEEFLTYLRELPDPKDAIWIIDLERRKAIEFVNERYDFIVEDTITNRPPPKRSRKGKEEPMIVKPIERRSGSQLA